MSQRPLFSIIMLTFNRPHLLKVAVEHLFAQTYSHLEIIIINNAATPETQEYLASIERRDRRVKLVHFQTNQFDPQDPGKFIGICFNAGLKVATGEYVFYQEDDDFISPEYVERMGELFQDNPDCITAAGIPVSVDAKGEVLPGPQCLNYRPRYMPGHLLALDTLKAGGSVMFAAPGTIFTIKRDVLINAGGFHPAIEISQMYGIVPFGVTGFDEKAILYWRRHEGQLNRALNANGHAGLKDFKALLQEWDIRQRWESHFGNPRAAFVVRSLFKQQVEAAAPWFVHCLFALSWMGAWRLLCQAGGSWWFWKKIPYGMWDRKWILKRTIKKMFGHKGNT